MNNSKIFMMGCAFVCGKKVNALLERLAMDDVNSGKTQLRDHGRYADMGKGYAKGSAKSLPDSSYISTQKEAEEYFDKNLKGVHTLIIRRPSGLYRVDVDMNNNQDHAYMFDPRKKATGGKSRGNRVFDVERARKMSRIFDVISRPEAVLEDYNEDLFLDRKSADGMHQIVVLQWRDGKYRFSSSHQWDHNKYRQRRKYLKPTKPKGELIESSKK